MAPRKRTSSGSTKKSTNQHQQQQQQSQPSKFGIEHFFERHTQNILSQKSKTPLVPHNSNSLQNPKETSTVSVPKTPANVLDVRCLDSNEMNSAARKGENGLNLKNSVSQVESNKIVVERIKDKGVGGGEKEGISVSLKKNESGSSSSQSTPTETVVAAGIGEEKNQAEVTPEFCKSVSLNKRFKFSPGMVFVLDFILLIYLISLIRTDFSVRVGE